MIRFSPPPGIVMVGGLPFSGPVALDEAPHAFVGWHGVHIVGRQDQDGAPTLYVGVSADEDGIGGRIASHEWRDCWFRNSLGRPLVAYAHIEKVPSERFNKERFLRIRLNPVCGYR